MGVEEPEGTSSIPDMPVVSVTLRPAVPMSHMMGVPYVAALGVAEASGVQVAWPHSVVADDGSRTEVRTRAGFDDDGMFVTCELSGPAVTDAAADAARARVDAWASDVAAGRGTAGPLAPVLGDYFDACALMGKPVAVVYPNGNVAAKGTLAGVDVWGRATVRLLTGREMEVAPEQASIRALH